MRAIFDDLDTQQNRAELRGAPSPTLVRDANIKAGALASTRAVYVFVTEPSAQLPNTAIKVGSARSMARRHKHHMFSGLASTLHRHSGTSPVPGPRADFDSAADSRDLLCSDSYLLVFEIETSVDDWHPRMQRLEVTGSRVLQVAHRWRRFPNGTNSLDLAGLARALIGAGSAR